MLDIIILAILAIGCWQGWHNGFVKSLCSFVGFFVGMIAAYLFYAVVGEGLAPHLGENARVAPILAFIVIWVAVPIALNFAGTILTKFLQAIFLGEVNSLLGAALGLVKYFLGLTMIVYALVMMNQLNVDNSFFGSMMVAFVDSFMQSFREAQG